MTFSCKGCDKRYPGCHDRCPEYLEEKAKYDAKKAEYNKKKAVEYGIYSTRGDKVYKAMRSRRK